MINYIYIYTHYFRICQKYKDINILFFKIIIIIIFNNILFKMNSELSLFKNIFVHIGETIKL